MQALKEWAVVCKALEEGRQTILLRKGGIMEYRQGFEIKHDKFLLFPTFEHQSKDGLKPEYANAIDDVLSELPSNGTSKISLFAKVTDVKEITDRQVLGRLDRFHVWSDQYVNVRMDYNPKKPMSVLTLRVYKLESPINVEIKPEWAGCKSWIPMESSYDIKDNGNPVLGDSEFSKISNEVKEVLHK